MAGKDHYYNRAKVEGYRSRAAFKLRQLDDEADVLGRGQTVVDLGAAPGSWCQVAAERVGEAGRVVGVDRQRIDPLEGVETLRGDLTVDDTVAELRALLGDDADGDGGDGNGADGDGGDGNGADGDGGDGNGADGDGGDGNGADGDGGDGNGADGDGGDGNGADGDGRDESADPTEGLADVVLSDMAPDVTGNYETDHARSVHLARTALEVALDLLGPGGTLVVKVFDGRDLDALREDVAAEFRTVREMRPDASRDSSSELYLLARDRLTAPVRAGEELVVEIADEGSEGDGVARVEGFTLFVPGTDVGEELRVRVTDVKPRFAFAERIADGE